MLPHGGEKIGVIGMGSSVVGAQKESDIAKTVRAAYDLGVNYFDMAGGHATIFTAYEKNGVLKYLTDLQAQGVVHHLGLSSHTPLLGEPHP